MEIVFDRLRTRFLLAILAGDLEAARSVTDAGLAAGVDADTVVIGVIGPALYEVGIRWASRELTVADEHVASATAAIAMEHLAERATPAPADDQAPLAVVACVEGEQHQLGARAIADALQRHGWTTLYCGASTPVDDLVGLARQRRPLLVGLSVARRARLAAATVTAERLHALDSTIQVVVGGQACRGADECPTADLVHVGSDFRPLVRRLRPALA